MAKQQQQSIEETFRILAEKTKHRRPEILKRLNDPVYNAEKSRQARDRIAGMIRAARNKSRGTK